MNENLTSTPSKETSNVKYFLLNLCSAVYQEVLFLLFSGLAVGEILRYTQTDNHPVT